MDNPTCRLFLFLSLLLALTSAVIFEDDFSPSESSCTAPSSQENCRSCFTSGADCGWCREDGFDSPPRNFERCNTVENLKKMGCKKNKIVNPGNKITDISDNPTRNAEQGKEAIQLTPQSMNVRLRPNKPFKFNITFRQAENYPVDLYYLMDLSYSMRDDKDKIASLGNSLAAEMSKITNNFRLGFGSFVDKKVMPYVSTVPEKLREPCTNCTAPYGFKNQLRLTENTNLFAAEVARAPVSGNLDGPEGGFDAIMQAIVCHKEIGWRQKSRKMLVFSTDAEFHYAGDGKLGGIVLPNDGVCHLDRDGMYSESTNQDYPSISQIVNTVADNKVNVIFAVTKNYVPVYKQLSKFIEGSIAGELAQDSGNIVNLVRENYEKIASEVELATENSEGIHVKFRSKCFGTEWKDTSKCDGIKIGGSVDFEVSVEIKSCPKDPAKLKRTLAIYPVGLTERLNMEIDLICQCNCEKSGQAVDNSEICGFNGTLACGACDCHEGRYGKYCECDGSTAQGGDYEQSCRKSNTTAVCSGRGRCLCGVCQCQRRASTLNRIQFYSGKFCECDDYSCAYSPDTQEMCGGGARGKCECGACKCKPGWEGQACECPISQAGCVAPNGKICNGVGSCVCGRCVCNLNSFYSGPTCTDCPTCKGLCEDQHVIDCVRCYAHGTGPIDSVECISNCTNIDIVPSLTQSGESRICRAKDEESGCYIYFSYQYDSFGNAKIKAQEHRLCPNPINIIAVVLGVIGAIVLLGLIALLIWKCWTSIHDRREYAKWEKESKMAKWDTSENPIYKQATSSFSNPTYAGKK